MPWKQDGSGGIAIENGAPVYVYPQGHEHAGKEVPFDGDQLMRKLSEVNAESASRRKRLEEVEPILAKFKDFDLEEAAEAIKVKRNLGEKKLIEAGEVDRVVGERLKDAQTKHERELQVERDRAESAGKAVRRLTISRAFAESGWFTRPGQPGKTTLPPDAAEAMFGQHFHLDGERIVPKWDKDTPIMSSKKYTEPADFDEAFGAILDRYPNRDAIIVSQVKSGGGATGSAGGNGTRSVSRASFDAMDPAARLNYVKAGGSVSE